MKYALEFEDWMNIQKSQSDQRRSYAKVFIGERGYPHIDGKLHYPRIGHDVSQGAWLGETVSSHKRLSAHPFLPFILENKRQRRFREPPHDYIFSSLRGQRDQKKFPHLKSRPIMYASHRDACIFSYYSYLLQQQYEQLLLDRGLSNSVIAYRSIDGKNNVDFAKEAFEEMQNRTTYDCLMLDVKGFFDNLDHVLLRQRWETLVPGGFQKNPNHEIIFSRITKYRYLNYNNAIDTLRANKRPFLVKGEDCLRLCSLPDYNRYVKKTVKTNNLGRGIPQGSPMSGVLANIYLIDFDTVMYDIVTNTYGGLYQRYSDDIFILCPPGKAKEIYAALVDALCAEKLKLGNNKTEAFRLNTGSSILENIASEIEKDANSTRRDAQYLGFHFDGETISFRPSTLSKHLRGKRKPAYMKGAYRKTKSPVVARQMNKIRKIVNDKQETRG